MNANATVQQLKDLKLSGMVRSYESVLQLPVQKQPEAHAMLAQLCDAESQHRVHYKTQFFLKLSKLRYAVHAGRDIVPEGTKSEAGANCFIG